MPLSTNTDSSHPLHHSHQPTSNNIIHYSHPLLAVTIHSPSLPSDPSLHSPAETDGLAPPSGLYHPFYSSADSPTHSTHKSVATSTTAIPPTPPTLTASLSPQQQPTQTSALADNDTASDHTGWESASMMGLPITGDDEERQDITVYNKLLQRVNEALDSAESSVAQSSDMEESLLHKVEEVLLSLTSDSNITKHHGSTQSQNPRNGTHHALSYTSSDTSNSTSTTTYDLSQRQLALDLSWADGTYRVEDPSSLHNRVTAHRLNRLNTSQTPSNQHLQRPADLLSPILERSYGGFGDSLLEAGRLANTPRNQVRQTVQGRDAASGMAGAPVDFPRIEYESFVDDDTLAEVRR